MKFNFETLTIEEVEAIEGITGKPIDAIADAGSVKGAVLKAIIYVMKKRENPAYTIEDAGKVSFKDAMAMFDGSEDDPKDE